MQAPGCFARPHPGISERSCKPGTLAWHAGYHCPRGASSSAIHAACLAHEPQKLGPHSRGPPNQPPPHLGPCPHSPIHRGPTRALHRGTPHVESRGRKTQKQAPHLGCNGGPPAGRVQPQVGHGAGLPQVLQLALDVAGHLVGRQDAGRAQAALVQAGQLRALHAAHLLRRAGAGISGVLWGLVQAGQL